MSKTVLVVFLILIFYIAFIAYSDFNDFALNISQFRLEYLLPVLGLYLVGMSLKGIRQQLLFKTTGISIPLKKSILLFMSGLSMEVTPAGSGKLIKSYYLKKNMDIVFQKVFQFLLLRDFMIF